MMPRCLIRRGAHAAPPPRKTFLDHLQACNSVAEIDAMIRTAAARGRVLTNAEARVAETRREKLFRREAGCHD